MSQQYAAYLAASVIAGTVALVTDASESDWQLRKPFRAGLASPLVCAGAMAAMEHIAAAYFKTDLLTTTLVGKSLKIATSIATTAGSCQFIGAFKHIAEDKQKRMFPFFNGLLCGILFVVPFCSDI